MKKLYTVAIFLTLFACNSRTTEIKNLTSLINKRLEIISKSYKHNIYKKIYKSIDHIQFDDRIKELVIRANRGVLKQSDIDELNTYIKNEFSILDYNTDDIPSISFSTDKTEMINQLRLTQLLALDNIIFLEKNYNNNFDKLRPIVCPTTYDVKAGNEYSANIYLTSWDPMFEPVIKIMTPNGFVNIPVDSCIGKYKCLTSSQGNATFEGKIEVRNELGETISLPFKHEFLVK